MSNVELKNVPSMKLESVLRRRKTTLKKFIADAGVQSYAGLQSLCQRFGVTPPDEKTFNDEINPPLVTSQQDGIVVVTSYESPVIEQNVVQPPVEKKRYKKWSEAKEDRKNRQMENVVSSDSNKGSKDE